MSQHGKEASVRPLVYTLGALLLLAGLRLALRFAHLGDFSFPVALGIAVVKTMLVAVFFMELIEERAAVPISALAAA